MVEARQSVRQSGNEHARPSYLSDLSTFPKQQGRRQALPSTPYPAIVSQPRTPHPPLESARHDSTPSRCFRIPCVDKSSSLPRIAAPHVLANRPVPPGRATATWCPRVCGLTAAAYDRWRASLLIFRQHGLSFAGGLRIPGPPIGKQSACHVTLEGRWSCYPPVAI